MNRHRPGTIRLAGFGLILSWFGFACGAKIGPLLGQAAADPLSQWLDGGVQVTALAVLIWALWYLLAKYIPGRDKAFAESLDRQQLSFSETLDKVIERSEAHESQRRQDSETLNSTLTQLRLTCARTQATLRGTPPPAIDAEGT